ncbi:transglutaminase [Salipiger pallidus]|uniref:Transglutaminase n=1 Tax=Salipiger pallidus TaxID=1775170 RepID=A0A8J3EHA9_9RHOB|nr:transglutaminase-like domain-containing protein [Salipiger pallidus]GGG77083.1 transglutaminase [Salipiger pallidus]
MTLTRRTLLLSASSAALLPRIAHAAYAPEPEGWRTFTLTTCVELPRSGKPAQAWVPVPSFESDDWQRLGDTTFTADGAEAELVQDDAQGIAYVHAVWEAGDAPAVLEVTSRVSIQSRKADLSATGATLSDEARAHNTAATDLIPTTGIVHDTAEEIVAGADTDLDKARAVYDWVVESSERNPETRGCGLGDVATMLQSGDLSGKCADLNALFVGLARAADLPARDLYGLRVAPSDFGYKSLGAGSTNVTGAQHCRADVFIEGAGWVPADPADVRKVILQEPPETLTLADDKVIDAREGLFGAAEGNWICYNTAHDVDLPGASFGTLPFLMYPQAEIDGVEQDSLSADSFVYTITAEEVPA